VTLVASAMGVSFVHGSNDGQKGIGLIMLVLIGLAPAQFVLNLDSSKYDIERTYDAAVHLEHFYQDHAALVGSKIDLTTPADAQVAEPFQCTTHNSLVIIGGLKKALHQVDQYRELAVDERRKLRQWLLCIDDSAKKIAKLDGFSSKEISDLNRLRKDITATTEYAPFWVIVAVALALGLGTMTGWKRIVFTVGEKIGKSDMTYSQGMAAQITAATAIGIASATGMPVSTTHVLSSAVAGTMVANRTGLQLSTVKTILLAWVFTLPATIALSAGLFYVGSLFI
ncbi:MAG TPA: inorganic phosphate transporter, partial [Cellvibrionaceae bacterium]|nr:inorganic phosphate transporter [Cellvibrionaceae bacterium]